MLRTLRKTPGIFLGLMCVFMVGLTPASASQSEFRSGLAPEPNPIPSRWELRVRAGHLRLATVQLEGKGPRVYYYLTYTVENNSGQDRRFAPSFYLSTKEGTQLRSGQGVPSAVTQEIQRRLDNPLLLDQISMLKGLLLQGRENAKQGMVVWPADDLDIDRIHVYCLGFSGETKTYRITDPETGQKRDVVLRKTLELRYRVPGEMVGYGSTPLQKSHKPRWIMR